MANVIRQVIQPLEASSRPARTRAKHARVECQVPAENAGESNLGDSSGTLAAAGDGENAGRAPRGLTGTTFVGKSGNKNTMCTWCCEPLTNRVSCVFSFGNWYCDWKCRSEELTFETWQKDEPTTPSKSNSYVASITGWTMDCITWSTSNVTVPVIAAKSDTYGTVAYITVIKMLAMVYVWDHKYKLFKQQDHQDSLPCEPKVVPQTVTQITTFAWTCPTCWQLKGQCVCGEDVFVPVGIIGGE